MLPTSVLYSTQIFYSNPLIFRLEHLSAVENTVKEIHFQDHIQEINGPQLSCFSDVSSSSTVLVNTSSRSIAKSVIYRRIFLVHSSEKVMVSVQNLQEREKFIKFQFFTSLHLCILHLLVACLQRRIWNLVEHLQLRFFLRKY